MDVTMDIGLPAFKAGAKLKISASYSFFIVHTNFLYCNLTLTKELSGVMHIEV
jgi:hypothetical protein